MAVYKANLFMTTSGISDQGEGEKRLGEIYVSINHNDSTTCKEVMSGDTYQYISKPIKRISISHNHKNLLKLKKQLNNMEFAYI